MLDVRPIGYTSPIAEQVLDDITPSVSVQNAGDEPGQVSGHVSIYRESLGTRLFTSVLHPATILAGETIRMSAESTFSPGAIADDDYFIICTLQAINTTSGHSSSSSLGPYYFDIKPGPMGPAPAAHHTTHELGGMDQISIQELLGLPAAAGQPYGLAELDGAGLIPTSELPPGLIGVTLETVIAMAIALG